MMRRRDKQLDKIDISILKHISVNSFSNKK